MQDPKWLPPKTTLVDPIYILELKFFGQYKNRPIQIQRKWNALLIQIDQFSTVFNVMYTICEGSQ